MTRDFPIDCPQPPTHSRHLQTHIHTYLFCILWALVRAASNVEAHHHTVHPAHSKHPHIKRPHPQQQPHQLASNHIVVENLHTTYIENLDRRTLHQLSKTTLSWRNSSDDYLFPSTPAILITYNAWTCK